jgi:GR25 family glycosyltransferase involved in LPS biosynthesis
MPAFVINLQRRPDRLALFNERCPLKDVSIIPGFDAKNYNGEPPEEIDFFNKVQCRYPGESAVYVSHLRIFKKIVENEYAYGMIFEDDAQFCPRFLEKYQQVLNEIPDDTHILYVGGRFTQDYKMKKRNSSIVSDNIIKHKINGDSIDNYDTDRTAHAYIVSNIGARKLLDYFYSLKVINNPIDDLMLNYFIKNNIPIYNSFPLLCHSPMVGDSDIRFTRRSLI